MPSRQSFLSAGVEPRLFARALKKSTSSVLSASNRFKTKASVVVTFLEVV